MYMVPGDCLAGAIDTAPVGFVPRSFKVFHMADKIGKGKSTNDQYKCSQTTNVDDSRFLRVSSPVKQCTNFWACICILLWLRWRCL